MLDDEFFAPVFMYHAPCTMLLLAPFALCCTTSPCARALNCLKNMLGVTGILHIVLWFTFRFFKRYAIHAALAKKFQHPCSAHQEMAAPIQTPPGNNSIHPEITKK